MKKEIPLNLRRPPSPVYLFIHYPAYRKWIISNFIDIFNPILPKRFGNRMKSRIIKNRGEALRLLDDRGLVISGLTAQGRKIFLELEKHYINKSRCD